MEDRFSIVSVEEDLIRANEKVANEVSRLLAEKGVKSFDIVGAIGAGKTSLLERIVERLKGKYRIAVITGDVTTRIDADRISRHGVETLQINTGRECALTAFFLKDALRKIDLNRVDILFVENVGNLICPADYMLGCDKRLVVVSLTEGPYVVKKHPLLFKISDIAVINKIDLKNIVEANPEEMLRDALEINPNLKVVLTSAKTGEGLDDLISAMGL
ncbi:MAG: hydrogenase nickel incorporation protein HypB [Candidatus Jordarchaeales archaeon]|nr:hydrogenase nickel incorporation protein HypB [Candidatus Jordarchaeia archaeon]